MGQHDWCGVIRIPHLACIIDSCQEMYIVTPTIPPSTEFSIAFTGQMSDEGSPMKRVTPFLNGWLLHCLIADRMAPVFIALATTMSSRERRHARSYAPPLGTIVSLVLRKPNDTWTACCLNRDCVWLYMGLGFPDCLDRSEDDARDQ